MSSVSLIKQNGIIGFNYVNTTRLWFGTDDLNNFNQQITKLGKNWPWQHSDISYSFNKLGHRTQLNPDELENNNYILVAGCSHTQGVGLPIESVYWNHLPFTCPIYNMGIAGSGNDLISANIAAWLRAFPNKKPKLIVCQRTENNRFFLWKDLDRVGVWFNNPKGIDLLLAGKELEYWQSLGNQFRELMLDIVHLNNIPIIEFGLDFDFRPIENPVYKTYRWQELDQARDIHGGPRSHSAFADWIKNEFNDVLYS
jgi:hypothetical protein